jgi:hypothetical protein
MGDPAKRRATYEDVLAVPEHMIARWRIVASDIEFNWIPIG